MNARLASAGTAHSCLAATLANKVLLFHKTGFSTGDGFSRPSFGVSVLALFVGARSLLERVTA